MYEWLINDPVGIMVFAFARNLIYLLISLKVLTVVMDRLFSKMNREMGIKPNEHIWNEIKKGNIAAAQYFGLRVAAVLIGGSILAAAFIK